MTLLLLFESLHLSLLLAKLLIGVSRGELLSIGALLLLITLRLLLGRDLCLLLLTTSVLLFHFADHPLEFIIGHLSRAGGLLFVLCLLLLSGFGLLFRLGFLSSPGLLSSLLLSLGLLFGLGFLGSLSLFCCFLLSLEARLLLGLCFGGGLLGGSLLLSGLVRRGLLCCSLLCRGLVLRGLVLRSLVLRSLILRSLGISGNIYPPKHSSLELLLDLLS